jgi:hypothetical protein
VAGRVQEACGRHLTHFTAGRQGGDKTKAGDRVEFLISDVFLPNPEKLLAWWEGETRLEGTLLDFSDSGPRPRFFAVVEVVMTKSVVVPVEKLLVIGPEQENGR